MPKFRITMVGMGSAVPGGYVPTCVTIDSDETLQQIVDGAAQAPWLTVGSNPRVAINTHMIGIIEQLSEGES